MTEQQLIEVLWKFVGWSAAAVVGLVGVIYASLIWAQRKLSSRIDTCATKGELEKLERDLKDDRQQRDRVVDQKLEEISKGIGKVHGRMDDLYRDLLNKSGR